MELFFITIGFIFLIAAVNVYDSYQTDMQGVENEVMNDYKNLIRYSKLDNKVLEWLPTLPSRFKDFINSKEYQTVKPYDKFILRPPTSYSFLVFMVVDKHKKLKLVVDFEPSANDDGRSDKYLKFCVGYEDGLEELIKDCEKKVLSDSLEKKRIKTIENIINKKHEN